MPCPACVGRACCRIGSGCPAVYVRASNCLALQAHMHSKLKVSVEFPRPCSDQRSDGHAYDEQACPEGVCKYRFEARYCGRCAFNQGWLADEYGFCVRTGSLDAYLLSLCTRRYKFQDMSIKDKQYLTAVLSYSVAMYACAQIISHYRCTLV